MTPSETEIAKACAVVDANADHRVDNKVTMTMVMMKMAMTIMKVPRTQSQLVCSFQSQGVSKILRVCRNFGKVNG